MKLSLNLNFDMSVKHLSPGKPIFIMSIVFMLYNCQPIEKKEELKAGTEPEALLDTILYANTYENGSIKQIYTPLTLGQLNDDVYLVIQEREFLNQNESNYYLTKIDISGKKTWNIKIEENGIIDNVRIKVMPEGILIGGSILDKPFMAGGRFKNSIVHFYDHNGNLISKYSFPDEIWKTEFFNDEIILVMANNKYYGREMIKLNKFSTGMRFKKSVTLDYPLKLVNSIKFRADKSLLIGTANTNAISIYHYDSACNYRKSYQITCPEKLIIDNEFFINTDNSSIVIYGNGRILDSTVKNDFFLFELDTTGRIKYSFKPSDLQHESQIVEYLYGDIKYFTVLSRREIYNPYIIKTTFQSLYTILGNGEVKKIYQSNEFVLPQNPELDSKNEFLYLLTIEPDSILPDSLFNKTMPEYHISKFTRDGRQILKNKISIFPNSISDIAYDNLDHALLVIKTVNSIKLRKIRLVKE